MKSLNIKLLLMAVVLLTVTACDKDFEITNENPNDPETVPSSLLLPTIVKAAANEVEGLSWGKGNLVMQYSASIQFTSTDRYDWSPEGSPYSDFYNALRDVQNILDNSEERNEANYKAVALILKSWMFSFMTDAYGYLPYSEASAAKNMNILQPKFDTQQKIYEGVIADLKTANEIIGTTPESIEGDILFDGDQTKWKKFANSLLLRIYMRLSDRSNPSTEMQAIISNPTTYPIMESNADNIVLSYLTAYPNQQPRYTSRSGSFDEYRLSKHMEDQLKALNDTRLYAYAQPTTASNAASVGAWDDYQGVPNGLSDELALDYSPTGEDDKGGSNYISRLGIMFACSACSDDASPIAHQSVIMSYAELQFILAEARQRGYINTGVAETYYLNGINASYDYYKERLKAGGYTTIAEALTPASSYFKQEDVAFEGSNDELLYKIGLQKWIALFYNGLEAWFDWRRTGIPEIVPGPYAVQSTVPVRFMYPTDVQAFNTANYKAAIAEQGADNNNTHVWVDVN